MHTFQTIGRMTASLGMIAFAAAAQAQTGFTGAQSAVYSGSGFQIASNSVGISYDAAGTLDFGSGAIGLTGIRGIWIVSPSGDSVSGIGSSSQNSGATNGSGKIVAAWDPLSGPVGYDTAAGFSPKDNWVTVGPGVKTSQYTSGLFNFTGLTASSNYDIGIDYMLANGNTGRSYFQIRSPLKPPMDPAVPEPSSFALLGLGLPLAVWGIRRRAAGLS